MDIITTQAYNDRADYPYTPRPSTDAGAIDYSDPTQVGIFRNNAFLLAVLPKPSGHYLIHSGTGNSDKAFHVYKGSGLNYQTVLLSSVIGGTATVEFSLGEVENVLDDTTMWFESAIRNIEDRAFFLFGDPFTCFRIVAAAGVSWTIEVRDIEEPTRRGDPQPIIPIVDPNKPNRNS